MPTTIHNLLPEILQNIFLILRRDSYGAPFKWLIVTHVCVHWRRVAIDFPNLWSSISYTDSTAKVQEYIIRSKDGNLKVYFIPPTYFGPRTTLMIVPRSDFDNLVKILEHLRRITELRISFKGEKEDVLKTICSYFSFPAPRLRLLSLHTESVIPPLPNIRIIGTSLRSFSLGSFRLATQFVFPSNLARLSLHACQNVCPDALLSCLKSCTDLEILNLSYNSWSSDSASFGRVEKVLVSLPHLQRLTVEGGASYRACLSQIFQNIRLPDDLDWRCSFNNISDQLDFFLNSGFYMDWLKVPIQCQRFRIEIMSYYMGLSLQCGRIRPKTWDDDNLTSASFCSKETFLFTELLENIGVSSYCDILGNFIRSCHLTHTKTIKISLSLRETVVKEEDWFALLRSMPSARNIHLSDLCNPNSRCSAGNFVRTLAREVDNNTLIPEGSLLCPNLEFLSVDIHDSEGIEEGVIKNLEYGLRTRKTLGFGSRTLRIHIRRIL